MKYISQQMIFLELLKRELSAYITRLYVSSMESKIMGQQKRF